MHQKISQFFISVLALLLLAQTSFAAENGLLWKVEAPNGKVSYLFGTMHSDDPRINDYPKVLTQALESADAFMMEAFPPKEPDVFFMKEMTNAQMLHEDELDKVRELADFHSMNFNVAMHMKPWLLAVVFDLPKPQSDFSQDSMLAAMARDKGKDGYALETSEEHFSALDSISLDEQIVMLRAVLKRSQAQKERDFETLMKAYLAGNSDKIAEVDEKITRGMLSKELWEKMRAKILDERNLLMAERLAQQANETSTFVAVGASHLAGETGLVAKLREKGFKLSVLLEKFPH